MKPHRKLPIPRLQRDDNPFEDLEGSDSSSWAISYSDLLMVLMSYFVIFFSFNDEDTRKNALENIALLLGPKQEMIKPKAVKPSHGIQDKENENLREKKSSVPELLTKDFKRSFTQDQVAVAHENGILTVHFSGDYFKPREYLVDRLLKNELNQAIQTMSPYKDQISLVVVGHSDSSPITHRISDFITDNYDLSSFRALHILKYLASHGLDIKHMSAQGDANNASNKRSFSLIIQMKPSDGKVKT